MIRKISKELFIIALVTWLILVVWELLSPGSVHRFINLEFYFYGLLLLSLCLRLTAHAGIKK